MQSHDSAQHSALRFCWAETCDPPTSDDAAPTHAQYHKASVGKPQSSKPVDHSVKFARYVSAQAIGWKYLAVRDRGERPRAVEERRPSLAADEGIGVRHSAWNRDRSRSRRRWTRRSQMPAPINQLMWRACIEKHLAEMTASRVQYVKRAAPSAVQQQDVRSAISRILHNKLCLTAVSCGSDPVHLWLRRFHAPGPLSPQLALVTQRELQEQSSDTNVGPTMGEHMSGTPAFAGSGLVNTLTP